MVANGLRHAGKAKLRIDLGAAALAGPMVVLRIAVSTGIAGNELETADAVAVPGEDRRHLGLAVIERLAGLMGGRLTVEPGSRAGFSLAAELPFVVDQALLARPLD